MRPAITKAVFSALVLIIMHALSCSAPPAYAKRMGWEVKERPGECPYERSLRSEYLEDGENDPKNPWRIYNKVMYYLARKKADTKPYRPPDVRDLLEKVRNLHVTADSAEIYELYSAIFAPEDKQWEYEGNYYVDSVLYTRAQQVIDEKGYDVLLDIFNELGIFIVQHGPLELVERSLESDIYFLPQTGVYVRVNEDKYGSKFVTTASMRPLTNQRHEDPFVDTPEWEKPERFARGEASELQMRMKTMVSVPVTYDQLEINDVWITRYPCPPSGVIEGPGYHALEWSAQRLLATVSISTGKLQNNTSLRLEHVVRCRDTSDDGSKVWQQVASGSKEINYADVEDQGTFVARAFSEALPFGSYEMKVRVSCGEKEHVEVRHVELDNTIPVELADEEPAYVLKDAYVSQGIPFFYGGSVSKDDTLTIFFPVGGLDQAAGSIYYEGEIYVLLYEPTDAEARVAISDYRVYPFGEEPTAVPAEDRGYPDGATEYGDIFLFQDHVRLDYPNAALKVQFAIPESTAPGTYMLGLRVLSRDPSGAVVPLGYGERPLQVR